jgi:hypothetical protein
MDYWRRQAFASNYAIDNQTLILIKVTERDAKLIEAGFANIGDFKIFAPFDYDIKSHDLIYDKIKDMWLELMETTSQVYVQITGICKVFVGKVTKRATLP